MPTTSTSTRTRIPDGYYSAWDAAQGKLTHWHLTDRGRRLTEWPSAADPDAASALFVRWTGRCRSCRAQLTAEDVQPDGAQHAGHGAQERGAAALLAAALAGRTADVRVLLGGADPAEVIAQLAETIATLAPLTAGGGEG